MKRHLIKSALAGWCLAVCALPVCAAIYQLPEPGQHLIGELIQIRTQSEDTFVALGRRYGVGYEELRGANPQVDPWLPGAGTLVTIPSQFLLPDAPRRGLVLNVPEMRLYYYPEAAPGEPAQVMTFPISIGRMDWNTPLGRTSVVAKTVDPAWRPPKSIREERIADGRPPLPAVVPPGPDNPLGRYAMRLGVPGYLIHGTNKPAGVGMRVTHGCIRMFPEDIELLFGLVNRGEHVHIVNQPFKMGWDKERLLLEVHPPLEEDLAAESKGLTTLTRLLVASTEQRRGDIDWDEMSSIYARAAGLPQPMLRAVGDRGQTATVNTTISPAEAPAACEAGAGDSCEKVSAAVARTGLRLERSLSHPVR